MDLLTGFIEEQGVTTTALGKLPKGVKANAAIESLKESEFANLSIALNQTRTAVKRIAEKMLDIGDRYFIKPEMVAYMKDDEPQFFEVIGDSGIQLKKKLKEEVPKDIVPLRKDYKVKISIEEGMAYTPRGKQEAMKELMDFLTVLAQQGLINPQALSVAVRKFLDTYSFGNTQEFMEALEMAEGQSGEQGVDDATLEKMKLAFVEVIKQISDAGNSAPQPNGAVQQPPAQPL